MPPEKNKILLFFFAVSLLWWVLVFSYFQPLSRGDWDQSFAYHELQRKTIINYHQLPLWNPYICGGQPWWAHPNCDVLSPFFILILIFGTIKGTLIIHFVQVFIGLSGMYYLSRYFKLSLILSLINSIFF